ncbi:hypothetical protein STIAU_8763 [Stigmatella aurantiaca DW4/3-1]|uniref:Uncharacterized protein n=1 Tax=Stigmatella aurantiaca (strain DW4/3-1) TaxID=378806 RepID=Q099Z9_STIAD|nr:hypothetical protein STIAU_8763 [Stigmatella aurantiaca DW4/3-1]
MPSPRGRARRRSRSGSASRPGAGCSGPRCRPRRSTASAPSSSPSPRATSSPGATRRKPWWSCEASSGTPPRPRWWRSAARSGPSMSRASRTCARPASDCCPSSGWASSWRCSSSSWASTSSSITRACCGRRWASPRRTRWPSPSSPASPTSSPRSSPSCAWIASDGSRCSSWAPSAWRSRWACWPSCLAPRAWMPRAIPSSRAAGGCSPSSAPTPTSSASGSPGGPWSGCCSARCSPTGSARSPCPSPRRRSGWPTSWSPPRSPLSRRWGWAGPMGSTPPPRSSRSSSPCATSARRRARSWSRCSAPSAEGLHRLEPLEHFVGVLRAGELVRQPLVRQPGHVGELHEAGAPPLRAHEGHHQPQRKPVRGLHLERTGQRHQRRQGRPLCLEDTRHGDAIAHGAGDVLLALPQAGRQLSRAHARASGRKPPRGDIQRIVQVGAGQLEHEPLGGEQRGQRGGGLVPGGLSRGKLRVEQLPQAAELLAVELPLGDLQEELPRLGLLLQVAGHEGAHPVGHIHQERGGNVQLPGDGGDARWGGHRVQPVLDPAEVSARDPDALGEVSQREARLHAQQPQGGSHVHIRRGPGSRAAR